jgi:uncharacterized membrane protein required for colicin V production
MIGPVTYLDVVIFGVPLILGLIVMWRGVGRSLLSMPVRLLVSLFLGWVAASAAVIYLEVNQAGLLDRLSNQVGVSRFSALVGVRALAFIIVFIVLMLILGRIRAHLVGDDADVHVGSVDRVVRFAVGAVLGLALTLIVVVPNYMFYEAFTSDASQPDAVRRSISLPLIKHVSNSMRSTLEGLVPSGLAPR